MGWEAGPADREAALDVSRRTAGVPLAIELGAVELLVASRTAAPAGSSTPEAAVRSAVEGAIAQLSDATRVTAARAARLVAGFTTRLVPSLVPAGASSSSVVQELVAGGLVTVETSGTSRRLRFLDRVRAGLLDASSDDNEADDAVRGIVLDLLRQVRPDLAQPPVIPALAEAIDELANVDALLSQVEAAHRSSDHVALAVAAADTWQEDGQWSSGARRLEAAVAASADLDPLTRAGAVRAWAAVTGTYDGVRRLIPELEDAAETARDAGDALLEGHLRFQLANAHGYAGHTSEAVQAAARLRELARVIDSEYVDLGVQSLDGAGRLMAGDHEGSRRTLDRTAERLEVLGALSDAARIHRLSSLASRAAGDLDAAIESLRDAERLASAAMARGTLATVRSDLADVRLQVGDPVAASGARGRARRHARGGQPAGGRPRSGPTGRAARRHPHARARAPLSCGSPTGAVPRRRWCSSRRGSTSATSCARPSSGRCRRWRPGGERLWTARTRRSWLPTWRSRRPRRPNGRHGWRVSCRRSPRNRGLHRA